MNEEPNIEKESDRCLDNSQLMCRGDECEANIYRRSLALWGYAL